MISPRYGIRRPSYNGAPAIRSPNEPANKTGLQMFPLPALRFPIPPSKPSQRFTLMRLNVRGALRAELHRPLPPRRSNQGALQFYKASNIKPASLRHLQRKASRHARRDDRELRAAGATPR